MILGKFRSISAAYFGGSQPPIPINMEENQLEHYCIPSFPLCRQTSALFDWSYIHQQLRQEYKEQYPRNYSRGRVCRMRPSSAAAGLAMLRRRWRRLNETAYPVSNLRIKCATPADPLRRKKWA